jgi:hypothetical protein
MVDLAGYDRTQDVAGLSDNQVYFSPRGGGEIWFLLDMIGSLFDFVAERFRKARVRRICRDVLPQFPASLVCPVCLFLLRRKEKHEHPHDILR